MKKGCVMIVLLCMAIGIQAQQQDSAAAKFVCDLGVQPQFPGGEKALKDFIARHLQWPKGCDETSSPRRVICTFKIQADGTCTDFKVVRSMGECFDEEALRVLRLMPKWSPANMCGKPCSCKYTVAVCFTK
jgi:TonB family protein